ncbi:MAG: methyltransferase [Desulfurococcaceae archaeon]
MNLELEKYRYRYRPIRGFWFTSFLIEKLRSKSNCLNVTLDLGLSRTTICLYDQELIIGDFKVYLDDVIPSEEDRVVLYDVEAGSIYEVLRYTENKFYKLKAIALDKAPTLEISGIHMHRIIDTDPWMDTLSKIKVARIRRGNIVLDTCTGLGYTSVASLIHGAKSVYTFEIDENVLWVAERNPWSRRLLDDSIKIYQGDATKLVQFIPDSFFHRIIHDPPRFTKSTGDLYSLEFYRELYRVLKPHGFMFHYTGEPRKHNNLSVIRGVKERLEKAGFKVLGFDEEAQGFTVLKTM